ncbi:hypothetical protein QL898_06050 [Psychrobacter sp. APC 3279]|uniref:hypothetical protein n=1 Tax=Psychrobacter sp. APC 3279 TaxID=3035189 RepID=UPI0025B3C5F0|nr:hypothetical protein [Psychrobacter sp. APC 3279]MDN3441189.1 hypothetical protein [Psychrobacter sp. APC 3279]
MRVTTHMAQRMNNRGIVQSMVDLTLEIGVIKGDKYITDRRCLDDYLNELDTRLISFRSIYKKYEHYRVSTIIAKAINRLVQLRSLALKMMNKGGVTVVVCGNNLVTTYNTDSHHQYKSY